MITEIAKLAGLKLDPWQALVLRRSLGGPPPVGLCVPKQNGKGALLARGDLN